MPQLSYHFYPLYSSYLLYFQVSFDFPLFIITNSPATGIFFFFDTPVEGLRYLFDIERWAGSADQHLRYGACEIVSPGTIVEARGAWQL